MTGALAWQVPEILNKIIVFVFWGEIARGLPGFSPLSCVASPAFLFLLAFNNPIRNWYQSFLEAHQQLFQGNLQLIDVLIYLN